MSETEEKELIKNLKEDIIDELNIEDLKNIVRYDRNWTVETIYKQIENGNIELEPKFQRRNAWSDEKKNRLIESIFLNYPIPEIIFAEHPLKRGSFIVIDGKQRLLTLIGFKNSEEYPYWKEAKLKNLKVRKDLEGKTYQDIEGDEDLSRVFLNADIRCAIISNLPENDAILYDMFYRLNAGSEPLTFQELRQVLYRGSFSDFLLDITNELQSFQEVMGLSKADNRLTDVEVLLRFFAVYFFGKENKGSLKDFLNFTMQELNEKWIEDDYHQRVPEVYQKINDSISKLLKVFGEYSNIARLPQSSNFNKFNKALFEVQVYYFMLIDESVLTEENIEKFKNNFEDYYKDANNSKSLTLGTNTKTSFESRFENFCQLVNQSFNLELTQVPY